LPVKTKLEMVNKPAKRDFLYIGFTLVQ